MPLRDGVRLNATVYLPKEQRRSSPCILTLTPYTAQLWHHFALFFAAHGYPFIAVDSRGRGNSEGEFRPLLQEADDGHDVVEWLASQPYCNGKVGMWGGSYGGYDQWATASRHPPHLATIVPVASVYPAEDFPMRKNVCSPYTMQWLTFVAGRTAQEKMFFDGAMYWSMRYREWFESGTAFEALDGFLGNSSAAFREWTANPAQSPYWDRHVPTANQRAGIRMPILTITGLYDSDQPGALRHYREHLEAAPKEVRDRHYLIIGPWHHSGTRVPKREFAGLKLGPAALLDLPRLHLEWYAWTLGDGAKPGFLCKPFAYYVLGAEKWRYSDSLESATAETRTLYLDSDGTASTVFASGTLSDEVGRGNADGYIYDPRDTTIAATETAVDHPLCLRPTLPTEDLTDQAIVFAHEGRALFYHSQPVEKPLDITGFFELTVWLAIDTPDTDFRADIYAIDPRGGSLLLSSDWVRARYRKSLREQELIDTTEPLRYDFDGFAFTSIRLEAGSRLRLMIGPMHSIYYQKNYNSGGIVAEETLQDARPVRVRLLHDPRYPSALSVPIGMPDSEDHESEVAESASSIEHSRTFA